MMELAIYFKNGQVAYFTDVKNFEERRDSISFSYFGRTSGLNRQADFYINCIAGWSLSVSDDEEEQ